MSGERSPKSALWFRRFAFFTNIPLSLLLVPFISGCLYLHSDRNAKTAADTLALYRGFQTNSGNAFDVMLDNHAKVQQALAERQATAASQKFRSLAGGVAYASWAQLQEDLVAAATRNAKRVRTLDEDMARAIKDQLDLKKRGSDARKALDELKKRREEAEQQRLQWLARGEFFRGVLSFYTSSGAALSHPPQETLKQAQEEILKRAVDGTHTVGEILKDELKALEHFQFGSVAGAYTIDLFNPDRAPGITVQILGLAEDVAKAQVDRVQVDLQWLGALQGNYLQRSNAMAIQAAHIVQGSNTIASITAGINPGLNVVKTLDQFRSQGKAAAIESCALAIQLYALAESYDESLIRELETAPASIGHEHSIRLSKISADEREAVILRALQSLKRYHEGGITAEEIANLIRAAEAAGIGVIAGRIN